jgi:hypothetical protein
VVSPLHETLVDLIERSPALLQPLAGRRLRVLSRKRLGFSTDHTRVSELRVVDSDIVLKVYSATAGLAHAKEPIALEIGRALWHALDVTRHEHADLYWDIFMHQVHTAIRRSLEMELQGWKPQSPWGKRIYAEGVAKGEAKGVARGLVQGEALGVAKGKAESVLALLRLRGVRLTRAQREQILSCRDERRLRAWLRRACMASTAAELFEPHGRRPTTTSAAISIK